MRAGQRGHPIYEEFSGRDALLLAVYERITAGAASAVSAALTAAPGELAARVEAGLSAYVGYLTQDPRRARVAHREVRAAGVLEGDRHGVVVAFADIIERQVRALPGDPGVDRRLLALALAGAVNELLVDWTRKRSTAADDAAGRDADSAVRRRAGLTVAAAR